MLLLALDTATAAVTVALHDGDEVLAFRTVTDPRRHAELLAPQIEEVLDEAGAGRQDLTAVCCGVGPGPFTSLRVGLVTARTLGFVLGIDVHGVCSLDGLAFGAAWLGTVRPEAATPAGVVAPDGFVVATDARRREVYSARYGWTEVDGRPVPVRVGDPQVGPAAAVDRSAPGGPLPVVGRGAVLYPDPLGAALDPLDAAADDLASYAALALAGSLPGVLLPPEPLYLRRPDAVEPGARKRVLPAARG